MAMPISHDIGHSAPAAVHHPDIDSDLDALGTLQKIATTDAGHPIHWHPLKKWLIALIYCLLQVFVTMGTTTYVSAEYLITEGLAAPDTSPQLVALGQSIFIFGTAVGPVFLGPLSDIGGRKWVYVASILAYALLNFGTALAVDLPMLIVFQFLCGAAGSTALSNVAGTIADLFGDSAGAGQPMALFVSSANIGASIGSPVGEVIAENLGLRWIFYINIIIGGGFALMMCFVPETLPRVVIRNAALQGQVPAPIVEEEEQKGSKRLDVLKQMRFVLTMALRIMVTEPIVAFLGVFNGFAYGLLFLYLDGVFDVFVDANNLSPLGADLTYLNFVVGVSVMFCFVPVQTWLYRRDKERNGGVGRPEARFLTSLACVWLFPVSLLWFGFTDYGNVSYWSPVVAGAVLGFCDPLLWLAMLNYIADSYTNVAASAIAAFLIPSFLIAAALVHAGLAMFDNMTVEWAVALLGFISLGLVVLVHVLYFFGPWLRKQSKLATNRPVSP
ncbi:vitamin b6 transporter bsu1 [Diplogelasinospora grovesii]|uniref:Vitamin b6 transporter bsu1 n=1 Tax=Diplogelasinospora grovesii TaxID=303347 RepID=A0AAN6N1D3_9PEZI|nr:vitamin b6 transporter bsu1 [Diplogelasinospora grovesii]